VWAIPPTAVRVRVKLELKTHQLCKFELKIRNLVGSFQGVKTETLNLVMLTTGYEICYLSCYSAALCIAMRKYACEKVKTKLYLKITKRKAQRKVVFIECYLMLKTHNYSNWTAGVTPCFSGHGSHFPRNSCCTSVVFCGDGAL
jgi:hypothetical protein